MAAGIPGEISAILNDAKTVIENCRNNDELYDKAEGPTLPAAPLADPPLRQLASFQHVQSKRLVGLACGVC